MVVLFFAVFIRPVILTNLRLHEELVALARVLCDRLAETLEGHEPQGGDGLAHIALVVLSRIIVAHQTDARIARIALERQFGILGEIADGRYGKTVHDYSLTVCGGGEDERSSLACIQSARA